MIPVLSSSSSIVLSNIQASQGPVTSLSVSDQHQEGSTNTLIAGSNGNAPTGGNNSLQVVNYHEDNDDIEDQTAVFHERYYSALDFPAAIGRQILSFNSSIDKFALFCAHRSFQPLIREAVRVQQIVSLQDLYIYRERMKLPFDHFSSVRCITQNASDFTPSDWEDFSIIDNNTEEGFLWNLQTKLFDISNHAQRAVTLVPRAGGAPDEFVVRTGIEELNLINGGISDLALALLAQRCSGLRAISLNRGRFAQGYTYEGITRLTFHCRQLTYLDLSNHSDLNWNAFVAIGRNCQNLTTLLLTGMNELDDEDMSRIIRTSIRLQKLWIDNCKQLTDVSLDALANNSLCLRDLHIGSNENYTMAGVEAVLRCCPELQKVNLSTCSQFPLASGAQLLDIRPDVEFLLGENQVYQRPAVEEQPQVDPVNNANEKPPARRGEGKREWGADDPFNRARAAKLSGPGYHVVDDSPNANQREKPRCILM